MTQRKTPSDNSELEKGEVGAIGVEKRDKFVLHTKAAFPSRQSSSLYNNTAKR